MSSKQKSVPTTGDFLASRPIWDDEFGQMSLATVAVRLAPLFLLLFLMLVLETEPNYEKSSEPETAGGVIEGQTPTSFNSVETSSHHSSLDESQEWAHDVPADTDIDSDLGVFFWGIEGQEGVSTVLNGR